MEPPSKKARKLLDDDSDSGDESGGVLIGKQSEEDTGFKIKVNEEYARRFEHNKKREELQRCMLIQCPAYIIHGMWALTFLSQWNQNSAKPLL